MTIRSKLFTYPLVTSVLVHMAGLASIPRLIELSDRSLPTELIPIEVIPTAPSLPLPPPSPQKEMARPKASEHITPPRLKERPVADTAESASKLPSIEEPVAVPSFPVPMDYPREAKELPPGPLPSAETKTPAKLEPGPLLPLPAINTTGRQGNLLGPTSPAERNPVTPVEGGEAGAGSLSPKGDVVAMPGTGNGGGSGGAGNNGLGLGRTGGAEKVTGINPGAGGEGPGGGAGGPTRLARPLGGYQIRPRYPDSARREGIEGVSLLRFEIRADGTVDKALIERSAGHRDLARAALEAVKKWRFEPARQGNRPVAVWVTLPVRFMLR
ncbi:MAG: energy transducer TonB [candidate division NC10 bacterium]|nr:energy transducer TonB [candidate division NC10 bacterium]